MKMLCRVQNEMFTFEIDSEIALVDCTLERWGYPLFSVPVSEDLKLNWRLFAISAILKKKLNPIAKCMLQCRAAGGGPPALQLSILYYKLVVQDTTF